MSKLLPYETIVKAHEGDPDAIDTVLSHYCNDILIYSQIILVNTAVLIYTKKKRR